MSLRFVVLAFGEKFLVADMLRATGPVVVESYRDKDNAERGCWYLNNVDCQYHGHHTLVQPRAAS